MKVMLLFMGTADESTDDPAAMAEAYERIGEWWGRNSATGTIIGGEELAGPSTARKVDLTPEGPVVTDGPFAEASEVVGGFALLEVPTVDAAVELARTWPGRGPVEVRPVKDMS
jgi:hypothetical protein